MDFEYDPLKSEANKIKHGIDFEEAKALWDDDYAFEVPSDYEAEDRYLVVGEIEGIGWTSIITYRDEMVRIISVRRSQKHEVKLYDHRKRTGREI